MARPKSATLVEHYRGAIVLNNIGVSLLEKGCYQQSLDTLRDAAEAMNFAVQCSEHDPLPTTRANVIASMVHRAVQRTARSQPVETQSDLRIINLANDFSQVVREGNENLTSCTYTIRIDDVSCDTSCPSGLNGTEYEFAVVVYNLGVANLCLARVARSSLGYTLHENEWLRHAVLLFKMSTTILQQKCIHCDDEFYVLRQTACVIMGVFHSLFQALTELGHFHEASELYLRQSSLRRTIQVLDRFYSRFYEQFVKGAPAA